MFLKADMHLHTSRDPKDTFIKHSPKELIDHAAKLGYNVLSITHHTKVYYSSELAEYARAKGILLIPGAELTIEGKHVLVYNITQEQISRVKTFKDLARLKSDENLVTAPHPYFYHYAALNSKLEKNIRMFDAIEHTHLYNHYVNQNKKAKLAAKRFSLPIVGNSDTHALWQMGTNYSLISSRKNVDGVLSAIKDGSVMVVTRPLSGIEFSRSFLFLISKLPYAVKNFL